MKISRNYTNVAILFLIILSFIFHLILLLVYYDACTRIVLLVFTLLIYIFPFIPADNCWNFFYLLNQSLSFYIQTAYMLINHRLTSINQIGLKTNSLIVIQNSYN